MSPLYDRGDFVAGEPHKLDKLVQAHGKSIIAKLDTGLLICRKLVVDHITGNYSLIANNLTSQASPVISKANIVSWSEVLCHFRSGSLSKETRK